MDDDWVVLMAVMIDDIDVWNIVEDVSEFGEFLFFDLFVVDGCDV